MRNSWTCSRVAVFSMKRARGGLVVLLDELEDRVGDRGGRKGVWRPDPIEQSLEHRLLEARAKAEQRRVELPVVVDVLEPAVAELVDEEQRELEVAVGQRIRSRRGRRGPTAAPVAQEFGEELRERPSRFGDLHGQGDDYPGSAPTSGSLG